MYYQFIPIWKDNSLSCSEKQEKGAFGAYFDGDNSIIRTKFNSLKDGLEAARLDGTCLREKNWEIFECSCFGYVKKRIMLKSLQSQGLLSQLVDKDNISEIYNFL